MSLANPVAEEQFEDDLQELEEEIAQEVRNQKTNLESLVILSGESSSNEIVVVGSLSSSMIDVSDVRRTEALISESRLLQQEEDKSRAIDNIRHGDVHTLEFSLNIWDILKKSAVNIFLPFVNGMMLGFGEILAHEIGFRYNWIGAKVQPARRMRSRESKFL